MVTSRKYLDTFSVQCFFSNSLPKLGLAKWVFVDGVQIVLPKGMILKKPVKRVPGQITELPNLQTHRINWWYIYIYHKNQLNILLGKYNGALILCLILWETVLCLPTSTMGTIPQVPGLCCSSCHPDRPFSCSLRQGGLRRRFKLESDSLLKKCTGSWFQDAIWDFEMVGNSHVHIGF